MRLTPPTLGKFPPNIRALDSVAVYRHRCNGLNRAVSFFRHWAGIPTDLEPPAAR